MRRSLLALLVLGSPACSGDEGPPLPAVGEACNSEGQCAAGLDCVHLVCADDLGPSVSVLLPAHLTALEPGVTQLFPYVGVDASNEGDQVEFVVDPATTDPHRELFGVDALMATVTLTLPAPLAVGPHRLRARVLDAEGQPYANPSATTELVLFVTDPDIPDTPQVAMVWPPSGYQHRIGNPLEIEIAVLPGSFAFAEGSSCLPIEGCEPELAPECEDACGTVTRFGHAKLYTNGDYPECLLDEPINCNGDYIASLRPHGGNLIDGHQLREVLPPESLSNEPGTVQLSVALSFSDHSPYPSEPNVIHETITLQLVE